MMIIQSSARLRIIKNINKQINGISVGEKAKSLSRLNKFGFRVPKSYVCDWSAFERFLKGDKKIVDELRKELSSIIDPHKKYAIRSSSNVEDTLRYSFAGQFETLLNVQSVDGTVEAILQIWQQSNSEQLLSYLTQHNLQMSEIMMGVIIQEMVEPVISGVTLTRNPVTCVNEIIIESVEGYGDQLMQKGANALRWVVQDGQIISDDNENKSYSFLVTQLSEDAIRLKRAYKTDLDIEWVFDGKEIWYLQTRPISGLSKIKIFSNRISRDMLPGMIKPLIWSVNIPLINSVWIFILESIVGPLNIKPEDLAHAFFYRTYFNMGIFGEIFQSMGMQPDALEMMMGLRKEESSKSVMRPGRGMIRHIPRIIRFIIKHLTIGKAVKRDIEKKESEFQKIDFNSFESKDPEIIFAEIEELKNVVKQIAYYNIVVPLLMGFHNRMLKKHLERVKVDFLEFNLMEDIPENIEFDPNFFLEKLHNFFQSFPKEIQESLITNPEETILATPHLREFHQNLTDFLEKFGHFSDSGNDFSYSPWRENLPMIIQMIAKFDIKGQSHLKISFKEIEQGYLRRKLMTIVYKNARKFRLLRDRVSSNYIYGYGIFRYYFLALGKKLVDKEFLEKAEDVFYLNETQIRNAFSVPPSPKELKEIVSFNKKKMQSQENITPPELIYGDNEPALAIHSTTEFRGIPASAGSYSGPARVVKSTEEFGKVIKGDVLIIPFSDVGWTPLFPKAGAVISESGGMLSHCAIVAREYGIPSIVSALGVMSIKDGQLVTVDANSGILYIN